MPQENPIATIVDLCHTIDTLGHNAYKELSSISEDQELSAFWLDMAKEENEHIFFWEEIKKIAGEITLPNIFDDPDKIIQELEENARKSKELLHKCKQSHSTSSMFLTAYRLEFSMLHPAFETFFHLLGKDVRGTNPSESYASHLSHFIEMLNKKGAVTPELELLGETLLQLWNENRQLARQANIDWLTGTLNRRGFFAMAAPLIHLAARRSSTMGVMMVDIDHFKHINDTHGHPTGDIVLREVADSIKKSIRDSDMTGRYGGEEFIVLLPETDPEGARILAERIRNTIAASRPRGIETTVSIGLATATVPPQGSKALEAIIQQADDNLSQAKESGRNKVVG